MTHTASSNIRPTPPGYQGHTQVEACHVVTAIVCKGLRASHPIVTATYRRRNMRKLQVCKLISLLQRTHAPG